MPKNIVACCDGTANEFKRDRTNVVKLFYALVRDPAIQACYTLPLRRAFLFLLVVLDVALPAPPASSSAAGKRRPATSCRPCRRAPRAGNMVVCPSKGSVHAASRSACESASGDAHLCKLHYR